MSMRVAIRYQSRGGHVKEMAELVSEGTGVEAISIDDPRAPITEPVDVLFIGGALYKFALDPGMEEYLKNLPADMVGKAVTFGSSALTRRPIFIIQERLRDKGISVHPSAVYMRGKPKPYLREIMPDWAKREARNIEKEFAEAANEDEADVEALPETAEQSENQTEE